MTISSIGTIGTAGNNSAGTTIAVSGSCAAGDLIIAMVAFDSIATTTGPSNNVSISSAVAHPWVKVGEFTSSPGGVIGDGPAIAVFYAKTTAAMTSSAITATLTTSVTSRAMVAWKFGINTVGSVRKYSTLATNAVQQFPGSITISDMGSEQKLYFRAIAMEYNRTLTNPSSTWTAIAGVSAGTSSDISCMGEFLISTASSATSNPSTGSTAGDPDWASIMFAITESNMHGTFFGSSF